MSAKTVMNNEIKLRPINKTAALVTSKSVGISESEYVRLMRARQDIRDALQRVQQSMACCDNKEKQALGKKHLELQNMLSQINRKIKPLNIRKRESVNSLIIRECIKRFTQEEWAEITEEANRRFQIEDAKFGDLWGIIDERN